jgi:hypothetical protein
LCPELPVLKDYSVNPQSDYWDSFPKKGLPAVPSCDVNIPLLEELCKAKDSLLCDSERVRAHTCIDNLKNGASSFQKGTLPTCFQKNAPNTLLHGREVSDAIASWLKKGFAAGPFDSPPLQHFRVNPLMAIQQSGKVRPVLNLSAPEGMSFNDYVNEIELEKVHMTSAKQFASFLIEAGEGAIFSKYDLVDAYKNVPVKIFDLRLQGFSWLSKFFLETRQIFGAKTAVPNYDIFGNTILTLANVNAKIPRKFLHRALDDVPVVSPKCKNYCEEFDVAYVNTCSDLNVKLADPCKNFEKAFVHSSYGKVLGYFFSSKPLSWKLPDEKRKKYRNFAVSIFKKQSSGLNELQTLMGILNHAGMFAPFLRGFKFNLNKTLGSLQLKPDSVITLTDACLSELRVWCNFLSEDSWHPLGGLHYAPPLYCKNFSSDAAGCPSGFKCDDEIGCGNIGFDGEGIIIFANQMFWPSSFVSEAKDKLQKSYGTKTTTLEFIGILIPFLLSPEEFVNQYVIVRVDNSGCFFRWLNRHASGDETASIFVRALHVICSYLACDVHIEHLPRLSNWEAMVVDRLSRKSTTTFQDKKLLKSFNNRKIPNCLAQWLNSPSEDWSLVNKLLLHVKTIVEK